MRKDYLDVFSFLRVKNCIPHKNKANIEIKNKENEHLFFVFLTFLSNKIGKVYADEINLIFFFSF